MTIPFTCEYLTVNFDRVTNSGPCHDYICPDVFYLILLHVYREHWNRAQYKKEVFKILEILIRRKKHSVAYLRSYVTKSTRMMGFQYTKKSY